MTDILIITAPMFTLIGIGYFTVRLGYFKDSWIDGLSGFVFRLAIPALLFNSIAHLKIDRIFNPVMILVYFGGAFINFLAVYFFMGSIRKVKKNDAVVYTMGGTFSNTVLIGIPLIFNFLGEEKGAPLFSLIAVHAPLLMSAAAIGISLAGNRNDSSALINRLAEIPKDLAKNPIIIALICGFILNLSGLTLSGWTEELLIKVANTAGPSALFVVGASLTRYKLEGNIMDILSVSLFKLIIFPLIVAFGAFYLTDLPRNMAVICVLTASLPTGVNAYLLADYYKTGLAVNSGCILLTTVLSVFFLPVILYLLY